jgi:hypothetical protein
MPVRIHALSNEEIDSYWSSTAQYGGCISRDQLPAVFRPGNFWIINLAPSSWANGTHWCLVYAVTAGKLIYLDPFGQVPCLEPVQCAKQYNLSLVYNRHDEQGLSQESCGYYSCAVAKWLLSGIPFNTICTQKLHAGNFTANQRIVVATAPVP